MCEHTFIKNSAIPCNDIIACLFQGVSAAEYINQAFNGQKGFRDHENCDTCGNENAEKKCSSCKFLQVFIRGVVFVLEADCSLLPHIVEHLVDHKDLRQFARLNEKTNFIQYLFIEI